MRFRHLQLPTLSGTYDSNSKKSSRRRTVSGTSSEKYLGRSEKALHRGYELGAKLALGSDAGAYRVLHGQGVLDEYRAFREILSEDFPEWEKRDTGWRPADTKKILIKRKKTAYCTGM